ncbi:hypothetical protein ACFRCG_25860 [Embleya sp. NPDC056575]|uniref:hypothetical protein n=1 Tax=unclassified Embleya TaxID=2699296 RepID=UPI00368CC298
MLAREYGYQVSSQAAIHTPGVQDELVRGRRTVLIVYAGIAVPLVILPLTTVLMFAVDLDTRIHYTVMAVCLAVAFVAAMFKGRADRVGTGAVLLRGQAWQVWPCRVDDIEGRITERRLSLLAPDGSAAATFRTKMPQSVWVAMTDGRGVLWCAGDLRFDLVVAAAGGSPFWIATPETPQQRNEQHPRDLESSSLDVLIREARSNVVRNLFG